MRTRQAGERGRERTRDNGEGKRGKNTKPQGIRNRRGSNRTRPRPDHMTTRTISRGIARQSQDGGQAIQTIQSDRTQNEIASVPHPYVIAGAGSPDTRTKHGNKHALHSPRSPCRLDGANGSGTDGRIDNRADRHENPAVRADRRRCPGD